MNIENNERDSIMTNEMGLALTQDIIDRINLEVTGLICRRLEHVKSIILYGSCARRDYTRDSDIDIAVIVDIKRSMSDSVSEILAHVATELAMKYFAVVNCIFIPYSKYQEKKSWYPFYRNIAQEGVVLYGSEVLC